MASTNVTNPTSEAKSDHPWIVEIRETLIDLEQKPFNRACVFRVPTLESDSKPEAYIPQVIALGPYHHLKPELYEMEHHKLEAVKRLLFEPDSHDNKSNLSQSEMKKFDISKFDAVVKKLGKVQDMSKFYRDLPACSDIFACIMAIDGFYLFDLISTLAAKGKLGDQKNQPDKGKLGDQKNQPDINAVLKDVLKLENQIPFKVLKLIFLDINPPPCSMKDFYDMLQRFCKQVSPLELDFKIFLQPDSDMFPKPLHLLDLLYHGIMFDGAAAPASTNGSSPHRYDHSTDKKQPPSPDDSKQAHDYGAWPKLLTSLSNLNVGGFMKKLFTVVSKILGLIPLPSTSFFIEKKVLIPSVSHLCQAGIKFCPTDGGAGTIKFDEKTRTFHLPVITMKRTTEVVLRNLVAYESLSKGKTKSLNFRRYTELMSAIVDTIEDVHLLRDSKVLVVQPKSEVLENDQNTPKPKVFHWWDSTLSCCCPFILHHSQCSHNGGVLSDVEIVEMFNGINRTMESKDELIDLAIEKANKCYNETQKVKAKRLMKKYVYSSWKMLTIFASLLLLLLTALQAVCDIYSCPSIFHTAKKI